MDQPAKEGLVFGIEGKWGSGKSSLINLTIEALRTHDARAPEVITFSPWLVGNRDELLRNLFDDLATAAVKIDPIETAVPEPDVPEPETKLNIMEKLQRQVNDAHWRLSQKEQLRNALGDKLRAYGNFSGTLGKMGRLAGSLGIPGGDLLGMIAERSGDAAKQFLEGGSVSKTKLELVAALRLLSRHIVVFIDDLDRLEPREASEVLRLIRAVADFPNVIYVLSYDPEIIAKTLTKAIQIDDGAAFLEKMVQISFRVPRPEAFDLRRWFQDEVYKLFAPEFDAASEDRAGLEQRLAEAIDIQGGRYLTTGRHVVRALNALRLHAIPVRNLIDIPDMVWLQLVRIGSPTLYGWVEEYLTEIAAVAGGAKVSDAAATEMSGRLEDIFAREKLDVEHSIIELSEILPGVGAAGGGRRDRRRYIFNNLNERAIDRFVAARRLGSPQHYRYYFAFARPAGALPDEQVQAFVGAAEHAPGEAIQTFAALSRTARPQGGTMAEVLIDRLIAWSDQIPEAAIPGVCASFANAMDDIALTTRAGDFGEHSAWRSARRAIAILLKRITGDVRADAVRALFVDGQAIGWLTHILRYEIFAHGHFGDRPQPDTEWLLTADEFAGVLATMLRRFRETPPAELIRVPQFLSLLYAWLQGSGTDETRQWVQAQTATNAGLLAFLSHVRGWRATNGTVYYPLNRRDLKNFLDYDAALKRVQTVSTDDASEANRKLASELLNAFAQGEER